MKKNVHTAGKSRKQKKIMLLLLELLIILLLAIALFITTKLSKIEKNKLDMNDVSINDDLSDETKEAMAHYPPFSLSGLDTRPTGSLSKGNSDVIMLANIDTKQHTINLVSVYRDSYLDTGNGTYQKCNAAYAKGGPEQALSMLNTNLDLAITDYVTVDFNAIIECVDLLGGVDITITDDEASLMIGYMKELNELTGHNSTPPASGGTYTLDGVQACAYARIRYGGGDDAKRTSRQRIVINLMVQKLKQNPTKIPEILDKVMGNVSTSLTKNEILELGMHAVTYTMGTSYAYPFQLCYGENVVNALGEDVVIPVTLEFNVRELHEYLYPGLSYEPSAAVTEYSDYIARKSGYDEDMIGYVLNQGPGAEADSVIAGD